jgi:HK97 gp10 family phage protein
MIDVEETLRAVADDIGDRLQAAADQAVEAAKQAYRDQNHVRSGEMVNGITSYVDRDGLRFKVIVPAFYSAFLEFGTKHQPARYVLQNAMHANLENTIRILEGDHS